MSTSDPDPARAPRAPQHAPEQFPPSRRFARGSGAPVDGYDTTSPVAAANAPAPLPPIAPAGDFWSHEVGTRRFDPSRRESGYAAEVPTTRAPASDPPITGPSIALRAYEQMVPPPSVVDAAASPSAFVTDALTELTAEDAARRALPPRRTPGAPSVPPPGFGRAG